MEAIVERCCGLDVHQASIKACLLIGAANQKPRRQIQTFGTTHRDLEGLRQWLRDAGCTHVAMESTGVYWMPVYEALEGDFNLIVGNATHIKNVPGRKTDVKDSEWIADLCRHGLIRKSFVPPKPIRQLRDLTRYRKKLVEARTDEHNRMLRLLETAGIKIASVMSDVLGVSGRLMLRALIEGNQTSEQMAQLARRSLRSKIPALTPALEGRIEEHHRFLLKLQLSRVEQVEGDLVTLDEQIEHRLEPYRAQHSLLMQMPGVDRIVAATIIAELGTDMSVFPSAEHAAAWAGLCPGNNESAGRVGSQTKRKGNVHLATALVQAALCAARTNGSYFKEKYWRLKARRGPKRAAVAVARKILIAAHHMLSTQTPFADLGDAYLDRIRPGVITLSLVKRLERLGYQVALTPIEAAA